MSIYCLIFPSVLESEELMAAKVERLLDDRNVEKYTKQKFLLSLSEAFTNALIHGNELDSKKQINVRLEINDNRITADIIDQGKGGLEKIKHRNHPSPMSESGRGVDIIKHYCTSSEFVETSTGALKVTLVMDRMKEKITKIV